MKKRVPPSFVSIGQGSTTCRGKQRVLGCRQRDRACSKLVPVTVNRTIWRCTHTNRCTPGIGREHLACHGKQDHEQPYNSHFVMKDEPITLLHIMEKDISHAEFAFLSARHTAVGDETTPDEVIHLAAGLQFSGFKSVIDTLWEVNYAFAEHVFKAFY
ncbi:hypothetical protein BDR04DRAFT_1081233 [Suillus decipiens]|nr:hypothetical protein BDR04DRAFT_1081233 [Suillus decipiens]